MQFVSMVLGTSQGFCEAPGLNECSSGVDGKTLVHTFSNNDGSVKTLFIPPRGGHFRHKLGWPLTHEYERKGKYPEYPPGFID